jgi:hypothetical protein
MRITEVIGKVEDTRTAQIWMKASLETEKHGYPTTDEKYNTLAIDSCGDNLSHHWFWYY